MRQFRTLLVIGENHDEIAKMYSKETNTTDFVKYKLNDAPKLHKEHLSILETIIKTIKEKPDYEGKEVEISAYQDMYDSYKEMDDFEFYQVLTQEYQHNGDGDVIVNENPNGHYLKQKCYDEQIRANQNNEAPFVDPFILLDGTKAYSATVGEIDWDRVHLGKSPIYEAVWEICVEGRKPTTPDEEVALNVMGNKQNYFSNFKTKDEYVGHCSAFWTYAIATKDKYVECNGRDVDWTNNFYESNIKHLSDDTVISLYEIQIEG
jgi:hypothetical protein